MTGVPSRVTDRAALGRFALRRSGDTCWDVALTLGVTTRVVGDCASGRSDRIICVQRGYPMSLTRAADNNTGGTPDVKMARSTSRPRYRPVRLFERCETALEPAATGDLVRGYYSAYNNGDVEAMAQAWPSGDEDFFEVVADGVYQRVSVSCGPNEENTAVRCAETVIRNDFYDPAGIEATLTIDYVVEGGRVKKHEVVERSVELIAYEEAFGAWLADSYPDVYESSYQHDGIFPFETTDDAAAVLAVVDEFIAQSDDYPFEE